MEEPGLKQDQLAEEQTMKMIMVFGVRSLPKSIIRIEIHLQHSEHRESELLRKIWRQRVTTVTFLHLELIRLSHAQH